MSWFEKFNRPNYSFAAARHANQGQHNGARQ